MANIYGAVLETFKSLKSNFFLSCSKIYSTFVIKYAFIYVYYVYTIRVKVKWKYKNDDSMGYNNIL